MVVAVFIACVTGGKYFRGTAIVLGCSNRKLSLPSVLNGIHGDNSRVIWSYGTEGEVINS